MIWLFINKIWILLKSNVSVFLIIDFVVVSSHCSVALVWIMYFLARKFFTFKKNKVMYIWFLLILVPKKLTKKPFNFALFGWTQSLKSSHFLNYKKAKPHRKYEIKLASRNFSRSPVFQIWMTYFPANFSKILSNSTKIGIFLRKHWFYLWKVAKSFVLQWI